MMAMLRTSGRRCDMERRIVPPGDLLVKGWPRSRVRVVVLELDADVPQLGEPVEELRLEQVDAVLDRRVERGAIDEVARVLPDDRRQERLQLDLGGKAPIHLVDELLPFLAPERVDDLVELGHLAVHRGAVRLELELQQRDQRQPLVVVELPQLHTRSKAGTDARSPPGATSWIARRESG